MVHVCPMRGTARRRGDFEHEDFERARLEAVRQLERLNAPEGKKDSWIARWCVEVKGDEKGGGNGKRCYDRASENDALPECWSHPLPRGSSKTSAWSKRSPQAFSRASPFVFDSSFSFASARSPRGRHCRGSSARSSERGSKVGGTPGLVQLLLRFEEGALSRRAP